MLWKRRKKWRGHPLAECHVRSRDPGASWRCQTRQAPRSSRRPTRGTTGKHSLFRLSKAGIPAALVFRSLNDIWKPNVVVAAIIEHSGKFLLIEEHTDDGVRLNQPAGHLEPGESLLDAVRRETLEETGREFDPRQLIGVYRLPGTAKRPTYIRFAFSGTVSEADPARPLDRGILAADWYSIDEIRAKKAVHRSPLVLRCIEDYLAGQRFPLDVLRECAQ